MNLQKISKAIGGGVATIGATGVAYFSLPTGLDLPAWVYAVVPVINFVIGFAVVYFSPANKPS